MRTQEPYVPPPAAASFLGLSVPALYEAVRRGQVPAYRIGRRLRFRLTDLAKLARPVRARWR